jgi:YfiH family protein
LSEFNLITKNNLSHISFTPFERLPFLKHAFSMKLIYPHPSMKHRSRSAAEKEDNLSEAEFLGTLDIGADSLVTLKQVHGNQCRKIFKSQLRQVHGTEGDCLLTSDHGIALGVRTADCFPVLMLDQENKVISCTHVGWRSLAKRILDNCLEVMVKDFSCRPSSILTVMGPGIEKCCYRVKEDVIEEFEKNQISVQSFISQAENRSFSLDLKGIILEQLMLHGLSRNQIHHAPFCTFCSHLPLPSFRREGKRAGRSLSVIMLTENDPSFP